jgi:TolA-binding protein
MTSCPSVEQLAAAAAGEQVRAAEHAVTCVECASLLTQQRELRLLARQLEAPRLSPLRRAKLALAYDPVVEIRALAQQLASPRLDSDRRARLAAETLALADATPARPWLGIGLGVAAAAAVAMIAWSTLRAGSERVAMHWPDHAWTVAHTPLVHDAVAVAPMPPVDPVAVPAVVPAAVPVVALARVVSHAAASISGDDDADFTRDDANERDTVQLHDGTISIDARDRAPVAVAIGDTTIQVKNARVEIRAAHGLIVSAHSFAGSVERTSPESTAVITAGEVWTPPPAEASLAAFRVGWQALHDNHNADALLAFERASDPVISEESAFWAAIAAQRTGDKEGASQRFKAFLDAYPQSPRADAARAALAKLP